jgi:hypothetical protein
MGGCDDDSPRMTDPPMIEVVLTAVALSARPDPSPELGFSEDRQARRAGVEELAVVEIARITARRAT